jgi:cytochrome P450/ferredoxin-NADP reductase
LGNWGKLMSGNGLADHVAGACPVAGLPPVGCPVSSAAAEFDAFDGPFQIDPAEALRWFRANEPVFWSPKLGHWIVTRYDDVKAVFRDTAGFSPANTLEKITPTSAEANAILARYGYAMDRTLVNEDEPAHTERRRALLHSFLPENLAHHEPMVRRLVREYVDRFIDKGRADLVDDMLWEVPLTVALHFLGVPEEDMATLREYSIAHTVNTWGRPSPREQLTVATTVGRFWEFAGQVLEKMRLNPTGHGWMAYAIRRQAELPDVITDSYLHSMMMAGIVAAHETTANAAANALHLLLSNRTLWQELCEQPALIPNAVEECLRLSGSIVAWRRVALADRLVGGVAIPKGARLLIVMTSANHDERHFENPDVLDIYRDNTTDHLSFGYGSHQCMGKNLARMEIRIILEELTRRIPHMELVADQRLTYLPNISFRGPEHLLVRWDPAANPERRDAARKQARMAFAIGAPSKHDVARRLELAEIVPEAQDIVRLVLRDPSGRPLPGWTAGAHVDLLIGDTVRTYSLCGDPGAVDRYEIAVLREEFGRGGSRHIHTSLAVGDAIGVRGPKNFFRLDERAGRYVLIAGGIGITPIIAMADRLKRIGKDYTIHYAGRTRARMAFLPRLTRDHGDRLHLHVSDEGTRLDVRAVIGPSDVQVYACGPHRLLADLEAHMADRRPLLHVELFSARGPLLDPEKEQPFVAELRDSGVSVAVSADQTLLQALRANGIDVPSDCEEGLCGSCEVGVLAGTVDHRDAVLSAVERTEHSRMMVCCSRARGSSLLLAL